MIMEMTFSVRHRGTAIDFDLLAVSQSLDKSALLIIQIHVSRMIYSNRFLWCVFVCFLSNLFDEVGVSGIEYYIIGEPYDLTLELGALATSQSQEKVVFIWSSSSWFLVLSFRVVTFKFV